MLPELFFRAGVEQTWEDEIDSEIKITQCINHQLFDTNKTIKEDKGNKTKPVYFKAAQT